MPLCGSRYIRVYCTDVEGENRLASHFGANSCNELPLSLPTSDKGALFSGWDLPIPPGALGKRAKHATSDARYLSSTDHTNLAVSTDDQVSISANFVNYCRASKHG